MAGKTQRPSAARNSAPSADALVSKAFLDAVIHPGSTLGVVNLTLGEVEKILADTAMLEREAPEKRARRLRHRRIAMLFYEASTRTRTSFELAAKSLGADTALVSSASSSIEKGESLQDTGLNLRALGAEAIVLRHPNSGAAEILAEATGLPVLNAGDGMHEHPSQALLDLRTILQWKFGKRMPKLSDKTLLGVTITICGDIFHSRVARSNALLLPRLGARVLLCGPPTLLPEIAAELLPMKATGSIEIRRDFDQCLRESDVVMMLRIQKERLNNLQLDLQEYIAEYQLNQERLQMFAPKALVLHPGPMVRGLEITSEVADGPQSAILRQVTNGVAIRMALLVRAMRGGKGGRA
jgi:aspartate carbamoyltransferase catalytic subunit